MSDENKLRGCAKYGCVGCLTLCALCVALIFLVSAVQLTVGSPEPKPEQESRARELPAPPPLPAQPDAPPAPELAPLPPERPLEMPPETRVGRVVVDLSMGDFVIKPGPAGEPIRVEADYDSASFELQEELVAEDDGSWSYRVDFGSRRGWLGLLLRGGVNAGENRITLIIPRGQPIDLVGKIGIGESETDLGGLTLRNVDLAYGVGEHFLELREPTPLPMGSFRADASIGEVEIRDLGQASPSAVTVEHGVGELFLDLQGPWRRDATVDVDLGIGEARLWLPKEVRVEMESSGVNIGESRIDLPDPESLPEDAPTLSVRIKGNIGELDVDY